MSKKIIIAVMVLIIAIVGAIVFVCNKSGDSVNEKIIEAQKYYELMDYDKSIAIYNEIISSNSTCAEAYVGLADAYSVKGNTVKALEILERGIEATGNDKIIADKITEFSDPIMYDAEDSSEAVTEIAEETITVTTVPVTEETTTVPETTTVVTTEETTTVSETTTVTTTEETTTTTSETTTVTTTAATTPATTRATTVTTAKPTIAVPNFIGITKEEARKLADKKNIKIVFEYEKNDTYANGIVFYQSNREGTMVAPTTPVYAYVCVNDTEYVSEEEQAVQNFYNAAKKWGDSNNDKVSKVSLDKKNFTVTVNASSMKNFVIDEEVVTAFRQCKNTTLKIVHIDFTITIKSSSITSSQKLNLSSNYSGNDSRATFTVSSGADYCTMTVLLKKCSINGNDFNDMKLYVNNKKPKEITLTNNEEPLLTVNESGTYTIK